MEALKVIKDVSLKYLRWEKGKLPNLAISKNNQCSFYGNLFACKRSKSHSTLATDIFFLFYSNCLFRPSQTITSELIISELIINMDLVVASLLEFDICPPLI